MVSPSLISSGRWQGDLIVLFYHQIGSCQTIISLEWQVYVILRSLFHSILIDFIRIGTVLVWLGSDRLGDCRESLRRLLGDRQICEQMYQSVHLQSPRPALGDWEIATVYEERNNIYTLLIVKSFYSLHAAIEIIR